jgi:hypothetical protein
MGSTAGLRHPLARAFQEVGGGKGLPSWLAYTLCQLLQQCSGVAQVGSVQSLGEPTVDRG